MSGAECELKDHFAGIGKMVEPRLVAEKKRLPKRVEGLEGPTST